MMAKSANTEGEENLKYGLRSILTTKFNAIQATKKFDPESPELVIYNVTPHVSFRADSEESLIIKIVVNAVVKETKELIMEMETTFTYLIPDLKKHIKTTKNKEGKDVTEFIDPRNKGLIILLLGVSYSTMRGMVYERNRGTFLESVYLPIVDPNIFTQPSGVHQSA